jgi:hypothetical protein
MTHKGDCLFCDVGRITVAFGNLEAQLELGLWQLFTAERDDPELLEMVQVVTAEMSFDRRVHALASAFRIRERSQDQLRELDALTGALFAAQEDRNGIIHSSWGRVSALRGVWRSKASAKAKGGLRHRAERATEDRLGAIVRKIEAAGRLLNDFVVGHIGPVKGRRRNRRAG